MCSACFLRYNPVPRMEVDPYQALYDMQVLRDNGYSVTLMYSEAFRRQENWDHGIFHGQPAILTNGPILAAADDPARYLDMVVENEIGEISMTSHGVHDSENFYRGTPPSVVQQATEIINGFNLKTGNDIQVTWAFLIDTKNYDDMNALRNYVDTASRFGVDKLYFMRFKAHNPLHKARMLSIEQTVDFFDNLRQLRQEFPLDKDSPYLQASGDFGWEGRKPAGRSWEYKEYCPGGDSSIAIIGDSVYMCPEGLFRIGSFDSSGPRIDPEFLDLSTVIERMGIRETGCRTYDAMLHPELREFLSRSVPSQQTPSGLRMALRS